MTAMLDFARLADAPVVAILVLKATALLLGAWLATWGLSRANPRWRVLVWRAAVLGLAAVVVLATVPPLVIWRVASPPRMATHPISLAPAPAAAPAPAYIAPEPVDAFSGRPVLSPDPPPPAFHPTAWLPAIWFVGVVVFGLRFAIGAWRLARIVGRAEDASEAVQSACREPAVRLGVKRRIRVVSTLEVASPCLTGVFEPVVLLPAGMGLDEPGPDLAAVLVHELTHVRNGDLAWNDALHLASVVLWFHPLAWRMRQSHAAACDAVCDAVAVDRLGDVATYGRALARLALRAGTLPQAHGLAMARACDVRRRIASLQQFVHRAPLPRRLVMPALLVSAVFAAFIGGAAVIRAQEEPAKPVDTGMKTLTVRAIDDASGRPLEGAEVGFQHFVEGEKDVKGKLATGAEGTTKIDYRAGAKIRYFNFTIRKPGYVPVQVGWSSARRPVVMPEAKEMRLVHGRSLGGVAVDEAGKAIEGASVEVSMPATESDMAHVYFTVATAKTDAQGRWRIEEAPADVSQVNVQVEHPEYRRPQSQRAPTGEGLKTVLLKGATVRGRVVGPDGQPVAGAGVVLGDEIWGTQPPKAKTDADGAFVLDNAEPGSASITVQADGFAPSIVSVAVARGEETPPVAVNLAPGVVLRGRVVGRDGKPLEGVGVMADGWRGRRTIDYRMTTDAEGRFEWKNAPPDAVAFNVGRGGLMSLSNVPLTASDKEHVLAMATRLSVSGSVVDAATKQPIPKFRVVRGILFSGGDQPSWQRSEAADSTEGRYTEVFDQAYDGWKLRIEAPGYKPVESRRIASDEGTVVLDFSLEPQAGLTGVVLLPDGKPAAGAEVALGTKGVYTGLRGALFERAYNTPITKSDAQGRFFFPQPEGDYKLFAAAEAGFAEVDGVDFPKTKSIRLAPWGRIEGRVMLGKKPGAGQFVTFQPDRGRSAAASQIMTGFSPEVQADPEGRFVIEKIVPMAGYAGRVVITKLPGGMTSHMPVGMTAVAIKPGETARVTIGGDGRTVVGRAVLDGQPDAPVDWARNQPVRIRIKPGMLDRLLGRNADVWRSYGGNFDQDGRFRAEDVPPGSYEVVVTVDRPPSGSGPAMREQLGFGTLAFEVPAGDQDKPVDVGDVTVKVQKTLEVGEEAPALDLERVDGPKGRFVLGDRKGKVVVLDFWATWCGPCIAEMPTLKEIEKAHGGDPRFELVGVSCDNAGAIAASFTEKQGLNWTQAFAGPMGAGAAEVYGVWGIPCTFVIGPDGRILAKNLRGAQLKAAVAKALASLESSSVR